MICSFPRDWAWCGGANTGVCFHSCPLLAGLVCTINRTIEPFELEEALEVHQCNPCNAQEHPQHIRALQPDLAVRRDGAAMPLWATCATASLPLVYKTSSLHPI